MSTAGQAHRERVCRSQVRPLRAARRASLLAPRLATLPTLLRTRFSFFKKKKKFSIVINFLSEMV